ncbi:hypothetical protein [Derxia gummosa]|uniref:Uncharacterized protein n=1 Tax=Derxia gummosa DSM 723 TaxID=1121388 RepID=A0A8B6XAU4_9BURK|nr:hypothetical protein [Derxia gummosa]
MPLYSPSSRNSHAFLSRIWQDREHLSETEYKGFVQFFYLMLCGHTECVIAEIIRIRLEHVKVAIRHSSVAPVQFKTGDHVETVSSAPLVDSVLQLTEAIRREAQTAPLRKLIELIPKVFPCKLKDVIGDSSVADLEALAALRNLFAHSRDFVVEFELSSSAISDLGPLEKPIKVLKSANLVSNEPFGGRNWNELVDAIHSDEALRYFYKAAQRIELEIYKLGTYGPSNFNIRRLPPLPDIDTEASV